MSAVMPREIISQIPANARNTSITAAQITAAVIHFREIFIFMSVSPGSYFSARRTCCPSLIGEVEVVMMDSLP